nr:integrase, catalytic region, zinc finger, CCHC-type, peptidase aspartic, catalytic [Tanacetum cinerariifolium]
MNFDTRSSQVKIDCGGSLSSQILASPSKEKENSKNLTVVLDTSGCLNVDVTLLKKRRCRNSCCNRTDGRYLSLMRSRLRWGKGTRSVGELYDAVCEHHEVHEMHDDVQPNYVVDSHADYISDNNMISYDQYVKDNAVPVVQKVKEFALNVDNVFQADDCDAFDSDVDEAPTAQTMFMANLSFADPVYDEAGPSYDSDILLEYVKDNAVPVVQSNVSYVPNDAYVMILNDMHEHSAPHVSVTTRNNVAAKSLGVELATYKEQVELGQRNNARGGGAAGYRGAQNKVGIANSGQARQIKCYNYN